MPYYCATWQHRKHVDFLFMPGHFFESEVFVSADILVKMMEFEWIDDLTSEVFVASFIYFPNADAISLCLDSHIAEINIMIDEA